MVFVASRRARRMPIVIWRRRGILARRKIPVGAMILSLIMAMLIIAFDFSPADGFRPPVVPAPSSASFFSWSPQRSSFSPNKRPPSFSLCFSAVNIDSSAATAAAARGGSPSADGQSTDEPFSLEQAKKKNVIADTTNSYRNDSSHKRDNRRTTRIFADDDDETSYEGDLPWSQTQEWALRDHVSKYAIRLVLGKGEKNQQQLHRLVRWRSLINGTPELVGYPLEFVIARYKKIIRSSKDDDDDANDDDAVSSSTSSLLFSGWSTEVLPYLDRFQFEANGGLSGDAFGLKGIQDGTRIWTNPVVHVEHSIPLGYVVTEDGSVVYELGQPAESNDIMRRPEDVIMTSDTVRATTTTAAALRESMGSRLASVNFNNNNNNGALLFDPDLVQLAGLTAVVLTGAWAMQALSHHLTVNIFWV
jgi:hypothetical protein